MAVDRESDAFGAHDHESGWRARWHSAVVQRSADVTLAAVPVPLRVLDVGCGSGALLRELSDRLPNVLEMIGVDPSDSTLREAREFSDGRARFVAAAAEGLPFVDGHFDLVVSTLSLHHWADQSAGLAEAARVLRPDGHLVLADQWASWLHRGDPPDVSRPSTAAAVGLLGGAGLRVMHRETIRCLGPLPFVRAFIASR